MQLRSYSPPAPRWRDKGKPAARPGRKATGPLRAAGLPNVVDPNQDLSSRGQTGFSPASVGDSGSEELIPLPTCRCPGFGLPDSGRYRPGQERIESQPPATMTHPHLAPTDHGQQRRTLERRAAGEVACSVPPRAAGPASMTGVVGADSERVCSVWGPRARDEGGRRLAAPWGQSVLSPMGGVARDREVGTTLPARFPVVRLCADGSQGGVSQRLR